MKTNKIGGLPSRATKEFSVSFCYNVERRGKRFRERNPARG